MIVIDSITKNKKWRTIFEEKSASGELLDACGDINADFRKLQNCTVDVMFNDDGSFSKDVLELCEQHPFKLEKLLKGMRSTYIQNINIEEACDARNAKSKEPHQINLKELSTSINHMSPAECIQSFVEAFIAENPTWYDTKTKLFWGWNDVETKWEIIQDIIVLRMFSDKYSIVSWIDPRIRNKIIEPLKVFASRKPPDPPVEWIQFKNTVYDINTKKEFSATSEYFFTTPILHDLGTSEETPKIDKMINEWVVEKDAKALYELAAYTLYRSYPIQRVFVLHGEGSNGKGTYLSLLRRLLGLSNICSTDYDRIADSGQRFERVKLLNKLVCQLGELEVGMFKKTSVLKALSSNTDLISGEIKGKNPFDFLNFAKIVIATNNVPMTIDKSDGFYRRFNIIEFSNQFTIEKDILSEIPEEEYSNLLLKLVRSLKSLIDGDSFVNDGNIDDRKNKYESLSNPIMSFIEDAYISDINSDVLKSDFKVSYRAYLKDNNIKPMSDKEITTSIRCCGYSEKVKKICGFSQRVVESLRLKTETEEQDISIEDAVTRAATRGLKTPVKIPAPCEGGLHQLHHLQHFSLNSLICRYLLGYPVTDVTGVTEFACMCSENGDMPKSYSKNPNDVINLNLKFLQEIEVNFKEIIDEEIAQTKQHITTQTAQNNTKPHKAHSTHKLETPQEMTAKHIILSVEQLEIIEHNFESIPKENIEDLEFELKDSALLKLHGPKEPEKEPVTKVMIPAKAPPKKTYLNYNDFIDHMLPDTIRTIQLSENTKEPPLIEDIIEALTTGGYYTRQQIDIWVSLSLKNGDTYTPRAGRIQVL